MNNINYKYTTFGLLFILIVAFAWKWNDIFNHGNYKMHSWHKNSDVNTTHKMLSPHTMSNDSMNMMNMTMTDMAKMMNGKTGKALEKEFIAGMIPHHQGAVEMSEKLLEDKTVSLEIKKFAEQIISAQEGEIKMMNEWLEKY
jgi:uncharacterized protein (DUF305 family)